MTALVKLDRQEAFNRAWLGLKGQGFIRALNPCGDGTCAFLNRITGMRCAWGHVDPKGTSSLGGGICAARMASTPNLATYLGDDDESWARYLQMCHDGGHTPAEMQAALITFAEKHKLTVPGIDYTKLTAVKEAVADAVVLDKDAVARVAIAVMVALQSATQPAGEPWPA